MAINLPHPRYPNSTQIRVKSVQTYAQLLLDRYPSTFNLVLNDGKRSGFYIRTADNFFKVGSLQIQSNVVPTSSEGLTPEEAAQILVKWSDITDRPTVTPAQIDNAILNPNILDSGYSKVIMNMQPPTETTLEVQKWYIISDGTVGDYYFRLPAGQPHLSSIKISAIAHRVINIAPPSGSTINAGTKAVYITNGSAEFVFNANTNDWLMTK